MNGRNPTRGSVTHGRSRERSACQPAPWREGRLRSAAWAVVGSVMLVPCYLAGEWLATTFDVRMPGSVLGMVLFFGALCLVPRRFSLRAAVPVAERLVGFIPFLLVPAAVGVVAHLSEIVTNAPALVAAFIGGWITTLLVTAFSARHLLRRSDKRKGP